MKKRQGENDEDNPSLNDDEWEAVKAKWRKANSSGEGGAEHGGGGGASVPEQRRRLAKELKEMVFDPEDRALAMAAQTKKPLVGFIAAALANVRLPGFYERIRQRMVGVHAYIHGITGHHGGNTLERGLRQTQDGGSGLACAALADLFAGEFGLSFAGLAIPLPRSAKAPGHHRGVLLVFEWIEEAQSRQLALDTVVFAVIGRLTPVTAPLVYAKLCPGENEPPEKEDVCDMLSRTWLANEAGARGQQLMNTLQYAATACTFEAAQEVKEKARIVYENFCFIPATFAALSLELSRGL